MLKTGFFLSSTGLDSETLTIEFIALKNLSNTASYGAGVIVLQANYYRSATHKKKPAFAGLVCSIIVYSITYY